MTTHVRKVVGSNPGAVYWVNIFFDLLSELYCLLEKTKNKRKRGRSWPILKKNIIREENSARVDQMVRFFIFQLNVYQLGR